MFAMSPGFLAHVTQSGGGGPDPDAVSIWSKLVSWYQENESTLSSGSTLTDAISGYNLSVTKSGASSVSGNSGPAISWSGGSYAPASTVYTAQMPTTGDFAYLIWVNTTASNASNDVIFGATYAGSGVAIAMNNATTPTFYVSSTNTAVDATNVINDGSWHLLIGQRHGGYIELSVDNGAVNQTAYASTNSITYSQSKVALSARSPGGDAWVGTSQHAMIFNAALTTSEINYLWNGGAGRSYAGLKADSGH